MLVAAPSHGSSGRKLSQFFRYAAAEGRRQARIWMPPGSEVPPESPWWPLLQEGWVQGQPDPDPALLLLSDAADWCAAKRIYGHCLSLPRLQVFWGSDLRCWGHGALKHPAIRVALGASVAQALQRVEGLREPLHSLPMGLDREDLSAPVLPKRDAEVLILASSNAGLGLALQQRLLQQGISSLCELTPWPTARWQEALGRAAVAVVLAAPAGAASLGQRRLAAMALQSALVCEQRSPDDQLCRDGVNSLVRPGNPESLSAAVISLLSSAEATLRSRLIEGGLATAARHRRALERLEFEQLLSQLQDHWDAALRSHPETSSIAL